MDIKDDPTLRPGDAVMTSEGIRIYTGKGSAHGATEFVPLASARHLAPQARVALAEIDKAQANAVPAPLMIGRSVALAPGRK